MEQGDHSARDFRGLATHYLMACGEAMRGDAETSSLYKPDLSRSKSLEKCIAIAVRKLSFRLLSNLLTPIIMIGPGTGVAPFRAFMQEKFLAMKEGQDIGTCMLFTGSQARHEDFLYANEWDEYKKTMKTKLILKTAFSREQKSKIHVQDRLKESSAEVFEAVEQGNAWTYLCGAATMAKDAIAALGSIWQEQKGISASDARRCINDWKAKGRLHEDVW